MMGSGTSKSKNSVKSGDSYNHKPVANVNKQENQKSQVKVTVSNNKDSDNKTNSKLSVMSENERKDKKKENLKNKSTVLNNKSGLQFEFQEESDIDNDIDEVLQIPTAYANSRKKNKDSKQLEKNKENNYNNFQSEDLPETYAKRLQRKQYKLQQDILIREKTIIRNSRDWEDDEDLKYDNEYDMESPHKFDASKFRAANKGELKKDFTLTTNDDARMSGYLQPRDHSLEDIGIKRIDDRVLYKDSPKYDKEELDLMKQLEEELM